MAQTGYTPISIYYSATATNTPTAGNLVAGELAINTADGVLYYKDSSGVVQSIASKAGNSGSFTNLAYTGTLTGGTGVVNLGSGQFYKDASGNVGIGITSPATKLHLNGGTLRVQDSTGSGGYRLDITSDSSSAVLNTPDGTPLVFKTNSTERMRINAGAPILCLAGGNTSATGTGITFPATQSASSDANTLDDYEEGTWTPNIGGNATYSGGYGKYTKIGNTVTVQFLIAINVIGTGSTGTLMGLPFASAGIGNVQTGSVSYFSGLVSNVYSLAFYVANNATTAQFVATQSSTGTVSNGLAVFANGTNIYGCVTYYVS